MRELVDYRTNKDNCVPHFLFVTQTRIGCFDRAAEDTYSFDIVDFTHRCGPVELILFHSGRGLTMQTGYPDRTTPFWGGRVPNCFATACYGPLLYELIQHELIDLTIPVYLEEFECLTECYLVGEILHNWLSNMFGPDDVLWACTGMVSSGFVRAESTISIFEPDIGISGPVRLYSSVLQALYGLKLIHERFFQNKTDIRYWVHKVIPDGNLLEATGSDIFDQVSRLGYFDHTRPIPNQAIRSSRGLKPEVFL